MKIFIKNLNKNLKTISLNTKLTNIYNIKYLPAFSKEWKNIIYSFNKNNLKNLPSNSVNINKTIKNYFNLFFKDNKFLGLTKIRSIKRRRNFLKKIYTSNADIKFTSNKAKITLYIINKEKKALERKFYGLYKKLTLKFFTMYIFDYKFNLKELFKKLNKKYNNIESKKFFAKEFITKKEYIKFKLKYLNSLFKLNNEVTEKLWINILKKQSKRYFKILRKYSLLYSLNQFKFNKSRLLGKLTYLLEKLIGKKLEYNIVNLKSITYHPEIFTDILTLKIRKDKRVNARRRIYSVLNKANIPLRNTIKERSKTPFWEKIDTFRNKFRDLKIISYINKNNNLTKFLSNIYTINKHKKYNNKNIMNNTHQKKIHNLIFNSIKYKSLNGIRIEVSGRLTKRYRADRAIRSIKWKGGLKNIDSSFKGLSTVMYKGNTHSNISYSWSKSKRRIGSFAVKGWISGK